jgi:hypothetical protein
MISRILPFLLLIIAGGLIFGYIRPAYAGPISSSNAKIKSYTSALAAAKQFKDRESTLAAERAAIPQDGLARLDAFLPDSVNNVQLILDLNALASRSSITLSDFNIDTTAPAAASNGAIALNSSNPVDSYQLTVTATGSYTAFRTFLQGIELGLRQMDVTNINVKTAATGPYTYQLTIRIYSLH